MNLKIILNFSFSYNSKVGCSVAGRPTKLSLYCHLEFSDDHLSHYPDNRESLKGLSENIFSIEYFLRYQYSLKSTLRNQKSCSRIDCQIIMKLIRTMRWDGALTQFCVAIGVVATHATSATNKHLCRAIK